QGRRGRRRHLPAPSALGKTSRRRGGDLISTHRCSFTSAEPTSLASKSEPEVAALPSGAQWPSSPLLSPLPPPSQLFVRKDELGLWLALLHPATTNARRRPRRSAALSLYASLGLTPAALVSRQTPHVPHLQDESDVGTLDGAAATRVHGRILLCLRMQAGGGIASPAWRRPQGANHLARSQDAELINGCEDNGRAVINEAKEGYVGEEGGMRMQRGEKGIM
ncbi:hypothetical protein CVT26_005330, partial [Gymnopilus dilepis]